MTYRPTVALLLGALLGCQTIDHPGLAPASTKVATLGGELVLYHQDADQEKPVVEGSLITPADYSGDLWSRLAVTGNWNGTRDELAEQGVVLDLDVMQVFQGVVSGGADTGFKYGGSVDAVVQLDTARLGLWPGGLLKIRGEAQFGRSINRNTGAMLAANTDALFPLPEEHELAVTQLSFTQFVSEQVGVVFGKLDTLDGDQNAFASGRGKDQFLNSSLVFNPVSIRTVPYSTLGAGLIYLPTETSSLVVMVIDTEDSATTTGFSTVDDDGTTFTAELRFETAAFDLPGHQLFGGTYGKKDFAILDQDPRILLPSIPAARHNNSWSVFYNFDQFLWREDGDTDQGVGVFGRVGWADQDTHPIEGFFSFGFGGTGIVPSRDHDTFGIGYFYLLTSSDLPSILDIDDGWGAEAYYRFEITPWFHVTPDLQVIESAIGRADTAIVFGVRSKIDF